MGRVVLLFLVVSCKFDSPPASVDGGSDDAGPCVAWETRGGHVEDLCAMAPGGSWRIDSATATYDTTEGTVNEGFSPRSFLVAQPGNRMLRVVSVDSFEVAPGGSLRVIGPHPLLVLSWATITVAGTIDVSSRAGSIGAGGSRSDCDNGDPGIGTTNAGGGGGGGNGQSGAPGGRGNVGAAANAGGPLGGSIPRLEHVIVGGCRGGNGGGAGGTGGDGGGAIQLTARTSITIDAAGKIRAGGMGGGGATANGGGGGGGGGGFIGLDAPEVIQRGGATLAANGGGGGGGCEDGNGAPGQDGQDANMSAGGGPGASCANGANGGDGGRRGDAPTPGMDSGFSGGGGGGGTGYIVVWTPSPMLSGIRSPAEVHVPAVE